MARTLSRPAAPPRKDGPIIVDDMVSRGASATNEQITTIKDYLAKNFGKVNVNKGASPTKSPAYWKSAPDQADAIVKYRADHGDFKTIDDLKKVPELASAKLDSKKDRVDY